MESSPREPSVLETRLAQLLFAGALVFAGWALQVGWASKALPGYEFRQAQTALSAFFIKAENNFSPAYPTPVMGKPWSIPMEFPLYQWTVVVVSNVTHLSLTKSGRAVSIACFLLCLPALYLLLERWRVAPGRRWLVLAVAVTGPLYLFYGRAFLIETMALMFGLWFWVAYERAVDRRSGAWLAVAIVAGTGAGLVKVTTFMLYVLPAAAWSVARLWRARRGAWARDAAWMAAAVAIPFAATLWWLRFSDATKALSVLGSDLVSAHLSDFNFGTRETRFSADMWMRKLRTVAEDLSWWPLYVACAAALLLPGARRRAVGECLLWFASVLLIFPVLYALHVYYFAANAMLLLLALGLAVVAVAEAKWPPVAGFAFGLLVVGGHAGRYLQHYYPEQRLVLQGGSGLTQALRALTNPNDVIVILGQDWSSITPYYAQRRALMFRDDRARDPETVEAALHALDGETIGAVLIAGQPDGREWLVDRAAVRGIGREPAFVWHDVTVYVPQARRTELLHALLDNRFMEVQLAPGVKEPREGLNATWREVASLHPWQRRYFSAMQPEPVRFWASFGPGMDASGGRPLYGAHPTTRLVFKLPAGHHVLRTTFEMPLDAYRPELAESDASDGVEITLSALGSGDTRQPLAARLFDPRHNAGDRGPARPWEVAFDLPESGEVELFFGPGRNGRDTRDWIVMGVLTID